MPDLSPTIQVIVFLLLTESVLRQNKQWNTVYNYLNLGYKNFVNWRADANIIDELKFIPNLFMKISVASFLLMLFFLFIGFKNNYVIMTLIYVFATGLVVNFSFEWVFKHKKALMDMKPMAIYMIFIGLAIVAYILFYGSYPTELVELYSKNNVGLPSQYELAGYFIIAYILVILIYYFSIWLFALIIPISILIILFLSSFISKYIMKKISKAGFIGLLGVVQILLFYTNS